MYMLCWPYSTLIMMIMHNISSSLQATNYVTSVPVPITPLFKRARSSSTFSLVTVKAPTADMVREVFKDDSKEDLMKTDLTVVSLSSLKYSQVGSIIAW